MSFKLDNVYKTRDGRDAVLIGSRDPRGGLYPLVWAEGKRRDRIVARIWGTDMDGRVSTKHEHRDDVVAP